MKYFNPQTQAYLSAQEIRALNPNTSFPQPFIPPDDYALVFPSPQPEHNAVTQSIREISPILTSKGHYEQQWEIIELFATQPERDAAIAADTELSLAAQATAAREAAKAARAAAVEAITVTTQAGNTFDGDETSQTRMARAIIALSTSLAPSVGWVLADNSVIQATAAELTEALVLAGQAQAAIWVI